MKRRRDGVRQRYWTSFGSHPKTIDLRKMLKETEIEKKPDIDEIKELQNQLIEERKLQNKELHKEGKLIMFPNRVLPESERKENRQKLRWMLKG